MLLTEVRNPLLNQQTEIIRTERILMRKQLNHFPSEWHLAMCWERDRKGEKKKETRKKKLKIIATSESYRRKFLKALV